MAFKHSLYFDNISAILYIPATHAGRGWKGSPKMLKVAKTPRFSTEMVTTNFNLRWADTNRT
jgi:hypothetical protein